MYLFCGEKLSLSLNLKGKYIGSFLDNNALWYFFNLATLAIYIYCILFVLIRTERIIKLG